MLRVEDIRLIRVCFHNNGKQCSSTTYYMPASEVATFVKATVKLHHEVGNPHVVNDDGTKGAKLDNLWCIWEEEFSKLVNYWWTSTNLGVKGEPGAVANILSKSAGVRIWANPLLLQEEKEADAREQEWERANS